MRYRVRSRGFSLIEVLFAIGMLGIGIVGILSLFTTGISAAAWSQNMTSASMSAQSLYTRILSETNDKGERVYLNRIADPKNPKPNAVANEWIHSGGNERAPIKIDEDSELWWQCRVSKFQMDLEDPLDASLDKKGNNEPPLPIGLYQVAIAIYRGVGDKLDEKKAPIVVYTSFVTAGY